MAKASIPFSNWNTMIQGLDYSSQDFFILVEDAIKEKQLGSSKSSRIQMSEGGVFSANREYLRVTRKGLAFDICGAPFGNGFFVSWWLGDIPSGWLAFLYRIPVISWIAYAYERFLKPETYYSYDTRMMYQSLIHDAVVNVVDQITEAKGLRSLTDDEKKPKMKDFFDKK